MLLFPGLLQLVHTHLQVFIGHTVVVFHIQVRNHTPHAGFPDHIQKFLDGFHQVVTLVPHMGGVVGIVLRGDHSQPFHFLGAAENARVKFQTRGETDKARFHGFPEEVCHDLELLFGIVGGVDTCQDPQIIMAAEPGGVHGCAHGFCLVQSGSHGALGGAGAVVVIDTLDTVTCRVEVLRVSRAHGEAAVAYHFRSHTLAHRTLAQGVGKKLNVRMGMGVNKAGGDEFSGGIDLQGRENTFQVTDIIDLIADDGNIGIVAGLAGTVNNGSVTDDDVRFALIKCHGSSLQ